MDENSRTDREVFRPWTARPFAIAWFLLAALLVLDALRRTESATRWIAVTGLLLVSALVYAFSFRPAVVADDDGVTLRNVVRDVFIPWSRVTAIGADWALSVDTDERRYGSWAIASRSRRPVRPSSLHRDVGPAPDRETVSDVSADTRVEEVAVDLSARWERRAGAVGPERAVRRSWAVDALVPIAVAAALLTVVALV
ncbi:MAG: PH domain-containing protein [Actinomycetota bacterium]|nr:PH domain-containing protein [Actinomycetota bacterium]